MKSLKMLLMKILPCYKDYQRFSKAKLQASYLDFLKFKIGLIKNYWPRDKTCVIANFHNIHIGINCLVGRPGAYLQGAGGLYIGNYVQIGPNVGLLTANHDLYDQRISNNKKVVIGNYSWVGMNSVILPGVRLGTRTIVAAGSVVTKSFPNGYCVIGGTPASIIKKLEVDKFVPWKDEEEFYGFIPKEDFENLYPDKVNKLSKELNTIN